MGKILLPLGGIFYHDVSVFFGLLDASSWNPCDFIILHHHFGSECAELKPKNDQMKNALNFAERSPSTAPGKMDKNIIGLLERFRTK